LSIARSTVHNELFAPMATSTVSSPSSRLAKKVHPTNRPPLLRRTPTMYGVHCVND
jgi:hypothetical protein